MPTAPHPRLAALLALLSLAGPLWAGTPRDELLRLVPDDVGFGLVVQNLRGHSAAILASPFTAQVVRSPFFKALASSPEARQLEKTERTLLEHLGVGWPGLRDDVFGDAFVLAYRPGPAGKPEGDQGLVLVRARTARGLAELIDKLNAAQKAAGELKELSPGEYRGVKYTRRVDHKETGFYCLRGPVLIYSGQEEMLRRAIDRELTAPAEGEPAATARLRGLGLDRAALAVWLDPRAFDGAVEANLRGGGEGRALDHGAKTFLACWKAFTAAGLGLQLDREASVRLAIQARTDDLPAPARRLFAEAARPSDLWASVPDDALFAAGGRVDLTAAFDLLGEFLSKESRQTFHGDLERGLGAALGKGVVKDVLPAIGPDWGLTVLPPADPKGWAPQGVFALRLGRGDPSDPTDEAILTGLHSAAVLAVVTHNRQNADHPVRLRSAEEPGPASSVTKVRYIEGDVFPAGVRPTFGLKGGYLILATSPDLLRRFTAPAGSAPAADGVPLLRVSVKAARAYLMARRDALADALAAKAGLSRDKALERLDGFRATLEFFDRLDLRQTTSPGLTAFTVRLTPRWPLE